MVMGLGAVVSVAGAAVAGAEVAGAAVAGAEVAGAAVAGAGVVVEPQAVINIVATHIREITVNIFLAFIHTSPVSFELG
jgi:hypothetical protein